MVWLWLCVQCQQQSPSGWSARHTPKWQPRGCGGERCCLLLQTLIRRKRRTSLTIASLIVLSKAAVQHPLHREPVPFREFHRVQPCPINAGHLPTELLLYEWCLDVVLGGRSGGLQRDQTADSQPKCNCSGHSRVPNQRHQPGSKIWPPSCLHLWECLARFRGLILAIWRGGRIRHRILLRFDGSARTRKEPPFIPRQRLKERINIEWFAGVSFRPVDACQFLELTGLYCDFCAVYDWLAK